MPVGISNLAYSIRFSSESSANPIGLGHAQQLVAAVLGYNSFAAFQAAQKASQEPPFLDSIKNIVCDGARVVARAEELGLKSRALYDLMHDAFKECLPDAKFHDDEDSLAEALSDEFKPIVIDHEDVNAEMASANFDGIDELYFEGVVDIEKATDKELTVVIEGHVGLGADPERPFNGDMVNVKGTAILPRLGRRSFGDAIFNVTKAELDESFALHGEDEDLLPIRSMSQAISDLLGIPVAALQSLANVEAQEQSGSSGDMVYGYVLDFQGLATPGQKKKILARHGSLQVEVGPSFFEGIRSDDWPN